MDRRFQGFSKYYWHHKYEYHVMVLFVHGIYTILLPYYEMREDPEVISKLISREEWSILYTTGFIFF